MISKCKTVFVAAILSVGCVSAMPVLAEDKPVIGANNTTYSPQNFSGRWKLRQTDGEICLVELKLTDAAPHALGLRGCTQAEITAASQWELQDRNLRLMTAKGQEAGLFKVTAPNTLEDSGMVMFR